jgi:hypothetical protein
MRHMVEFFFMNEAVIKQQKSCTTIVVGTSEGQGRRKLERFKDLIQATR